MVQMEKAQENKKKCTKCGAILDAIIGNFYKDSSKKDNLSSSCADCCRKTKSKTYKNVISPRLKTERAIARESYLQSEEYKQKKEESKRKDLERKRRWRDKNREKINEKARLSIKKPISAEKRKEYKARQYEKIMSCPYKKHIHYMRVRIRDIVKSSGNDINFSISKTILFSKNELINRLESMFKEGMNWDNYGRGGWHIDHIKPLASFDITKEEELIKAFSIENIQPMFESENLSKGSLYDGFRFSHTKSGKMVNESQSKNRARNRGKK